jgi:septum formation inhibitor-activating ATPase MinD
MVRQPQRFINIVSHQHNRASQQAMNADHLLLQRFARHRIERAEGFIHQQHLRVGRQRAATPTRCCWPPES